DVRPLGGVNSARHIAVPESNCIHRKNAEGSGHPRKRSAWGARGEFCSCHNRPGKVGMTEPLSTRLARCYTAAVHDVMRAVGLRDFVLLHEIVPLRPDSKVAARAFTFRGRVEPGIAAHDTHMGWTAFLSQAPAGSVAVCQPNERIVAHMGELSAETLKRRGV